MKLKHCLITVFLIILTGCAPDSKTTEVLPANSQAPTTSQTSAPVKLETPKPTEIITPTASVNHSLENCLSVGTEKSIDYASQGSLILSGSIDTTRGSEYKMNLENNETTEIADPILDIIISPDRKLMAYESYVSSTNSGSLIITDSSGRQIKNIPWKTEWLYLSSWLDPNRLMISMKTGPSDGTSVADQFRKFQAYNPFTEKGVIVQPDLKEIFIAPGFTGLTGDGFNPQLDRVVYLQGDRAFIEPLHYVLWDLKQKRSLANFEVVISPTAFPTWALDGSRFALAASMKEDIYQTWPAYELYSVSRDGQVTQLTHLTDYYPWVYIEDYSWSSDGKYIAFWFLWWSGEKPGYDLQGNHYLAVVDTEHNDVTNFCIRGRLGDDGRAHTPVWSPDGKQLVVESLSPEGNSRVVLIDLVRQTAVQIGEDMTPIGWMTAP